MSSYMHCKKRYTSEHCKGIYALCTACSAVGVVRFCCETTVRLVYRAIKVQTKGEGATTLLYGAASQPHTCFPPHPARLAHSNYIPCESYVQSAQSLNCVQSGVRHSVCNAVFWQHRSQAPPSFPSLAVRLSDEMLREAL